jgi:hypothetical protein
MAGDPAQASGDQSGQVHPGDSRYGQQCRGLLHRGGDPGLDWLGVGQHGPATRPGALPVDAKARDTDDMVDDTARDRAIYHALKAVDEVAAALQTHLIEEHGADPERAAAQNSSSNSLKLLRQARERLGEGLRAVKADGIAESDAISLRNQ